MQNGSMNTYMTGLAAALAVVPAVWAQGTTLPGGVCEAFDLYTALPDTLTPLLQEAKDLKSADAVAVKLHALLPRIYETRTAVERIPQLDAKQTQELERRYGKRAQVAWGGVYQEIFRLQKNQCFGSTALAKEFNIMCMMLK